MQHDDCTRAIPASVHVWSCGAESHMLSRCSLLRMLIDWIEFIIPSSWHELHETPMLRQDTLFDMSVASACRGPRQATCDMKFTGTLGAIAKLFIVMVNTIVFIAISTVKGGRFHPLSVIIAELTYLCVILS